MEGLPVFNGPEYWREHWRLRLKQAVEARNYSKETLKNYDLALRAFLDTSPGAPRYWKRTRIQAFLAAQKAAGKSPSTVNLYLDGLAFFCKQVIGVSACLEGIPRMKETQSLPKILDAKNISLMLQAIDEVREIPLLYGCRKKSG